MLNLLSPRVLLQLLFASMILIGLGWGIGQHFANNNLTGDNRQVTIDVGPQQVLATIVETPQARRQGLMHVSSMPEHSGMLFIFEQPQPLVFWMKNTLIDLDIAFFDASGHCLNIAQMQAGDSKQRHYSKGPGLYALEMNRGWFERNRVSCNGLQLNTAQFVSSN